MYFYFTAPPGRNLLAGNRVLASQARVATAAPRRNAPPAPARGLTLTRDAR